MSWAIVLLWGGCAPRSDTVSGQVFIVTQGRDNVKLGLVTVALLSEEEAAKHVAKRQEDHRRELAAVRQSNESASQRAMSDFERAKERARTAAENLRPELQRVEAQLAEATKGYMRVLPDAQAAEDIEDIYGEAFVTAIRSGGEVTGSLKAERDRTSRLANQAYVEVHKWELARNALRARIPSPVAKIPAERPEPRLTSAFYFQGMPPALATTQSDADGKFSLTVPKTGKFVLAAQAERTLLGSTETYFWLIRVPEDARRGTPVLLGNTTLTTAGSSLSLIKAFE